MGQTGKANGIVCAALLLLTSCGGVPAQAGQTDLCVSCADPAQTYICRVETPDGNPGEKSLQLFCIVKTAKLGGHSACSVRNATGADCQGQVISHRYDGPVLPAALRERAVIPDRPQAMPGQDISGLPPPPAQRGGEPDTLLEMTGPAVEAGKAAARTTSRAVRNAASSTGETVGNLGRKAGRGASEATRDAGSAVGNAARYTYSCIRSLFRHCGGSSADQ